MTPIAARARIDPRVAHTRKVVTEAAAELLIAEGFGKVTIDAIAERSGVARSTIYRHWPDRIDLLRDVFVVVCTVDGAETTGSLHGDLRRKGLGLAEGLTNEAWGQVLPTAVAAAEHDLDLREALAAFTGDRRDEAAELVAAAVERGELVLDPTLDLHAVLERFAGPFFFRRLMTGAPLDAAFVEGQVRSTCEALDAPYEPVD